MYSANAFIIRWLSCIFSLFLDLFLQWLHNKFSRKKTKQNKNRKLVHMICVNKILSDPPYCALPHSPPEPHPLPIKKKKKKGVNHDYWTAVWDSAVLTWVTRRGASWARDELEEMLVSTFPIRHQSLAWSCTIMYIHTNAKRTMSPLPWKQTFTFPYPFIKGHFFLYSKPNAYLFGHIKVVPWNTGYFCYVAAWNTNIPFTKCHHGSIIKTQTKMWLALKMKVTKTC